MDGAVRSAERALVACADLELLDLVGVKPLPGLRTGVLAWETPSHRGGAATEVTLGLKTEVEAEAARRGMDTTHVMANTLRKHATGFGGTGLKAKKKGQKASRAEREEARQGRKAALRAAAVRRWGVEPKTEDEADALCVLAWALDQIGEGTWTAR